LHNGYHVCHFCFDDFMLGDIYQHIYRTVQFTRIIEKRLGIRGNIAAAAIGSFNDDFFTVYGPAFF